MSTGDRYGTRIVSIVSGIVDPLETSFVSMGLALKARHAGCGRSWLCLLGLWLRKQSGRWAYFSTEAVQPLLYLVGAVLEAGKWGGNNNK